MFDNDVLKSVKEKNPNSTLYVGEISFKDQENKQYELEFIWRAPTVADMEAYNKAAAKNAFTAQNNLLVSLVVHPDPKSVADVIQKFPAVTADFVEKQVSPFFGTEVVSTSRKL